MKTQAKGEGTLTETKEEMVTEVTEVIEETEVTEGIEVTEVIEVIGKVELTETELTETEVTETEVTETIEASEQAIEAISRIGENGLTDLTGIEATGSPEEKARTGERTPTTEEINMTDDQRDGA